MLFIVFANYLAITTKPNTLSLKLYMDITTNVDGFILVLVPPRQCTVEDKTKRMCFGVSSIVLYVLHH